MPPTFQVLSIPRLQAIQALRAHGKIPAFRWRRARLRHLPSGDSIHFGGIMVSKLRDWLSRSLLVAAALCLGGVAQATVIFTTTATLSTSDPTQAGRLFRTGQPSDWSSSKAYPGQSGSATIHYQTFLLDLEMLMADYVAPGNYLQINVDFGTSLNPFVSTYLNSYNPLDRGANYLGDIGASGNDFGNPTFFQVIADNADDLVLLVNETTANGGLSQPISILVEAFTDTEYTDLVAKPTATVPVPGSLSLAVLAIGLFGVRRRVRRLEPA